MLNINAHTEIMYEKHERPGHDKYGKSKGEMGLYIYIIFLYYIYTYMYINIVFKKHNNKKYPKFGRCSKKREKWENRKKHPQFL